MSVASRTLCCTLTLSSPNFPPRTVCFNHETEFLVLWSWIYLNFARKALFHTSVTFSLRFHQKMYNILLWCMRISQYLFIFFAELFHFFCFLLVLLLFFFRLSYSPYNYFLLFISFLLTEKFVLDKILFYFSLRYDDGIPVKHIASRGPSGVFYATPTEIPKTQQFGVSLTWYVYNFHTWKHTYNSTVCS